MRYNFQDPSDRATQEEEFSLELRTRIGRKLIKRLIKPVRIEEDDYGFVINAVSILV